MSDPSNDTTSQVGLGKPKFYVMSPSAERDMLAKGIVLDAPYRTHPALPPHAYYGIFEYEGDIEEYLSELDAALSMMAVEGEQA